MQKNSADVAHHAPINISVAQEQPVHLDLGMTGVENPYPGLFLVKHKKSILYQRASSPSPSSSPPRGKAATPLR